MSVNNFTRDLNSAVFEIMNKRLEDLAALEGTVVSLSADLISLKPGWEHKGIQEKEEAAKKIIHDTQDMIYGLWSDSAYAKDYDRKEEEYFSDVLYGNAKNK